mmetsp:Transcript_8462/g.15955  ORF Transcript_8462/g.15955 Transcript_8462/m.15955 type:complete len:924 (-) Transcript_8462:152-2923(-)
MSSRQLRIPGHRPISRSGDQDRPSSGGSQSRRFSKLSVYEAPQRPLRIPGRRPIERPATRERLYANAASSRSSTSITRKTADPRLGPTARCVSQAVRPRTASSASKSAIADCILAREASLRRLRQIADAHAEGSRLFSEVQRELIDTLLRLRQLSLEVTEGIESWRAGGLSGSGIWLDPVGENNYLLKMKEDTRWLSDSPLGEIMAFSARSDPFFVVPSARDAQIVADMGANLSLAPSNQMTATLRTTGQGPSSDDYKVVLPLTSSLLRRIRKAELVILRDSVQARVEHNSAAFAVPVVDATTPANRVGSTCTWQGPEVMADRGSASTLSSPSITTTTSKVNLGKKQSKLLATCTGVFEEVLGHVRTSVELAETFWPNLEARKRPPRPATPSGPVRLEPVRTAAASVRAVYEEYVARAQQQLVSSLEPWSVLEASLNDRSPCALEWFWLFRAGHTLSMNRPEGLTVFRLKKMSTNIGQLLHLSVTDMRIFEDAIAAVKAWMFTFLPIRSIRVTLWHTMRDGELQLDKEVEHFYKRCRFRWFQLTNHNGMRGQVLNGPRFAAPECEDGPDPVLYAELPCIEICIGQVWMRGAKHPSAIGSRRGSCASNSALAATCLHHFRTKDLSETRRLADIANASAREAAREGLIQGLLSGSLDALLVKSKPMILREDADSLEALNSPAKVAAYLARSMEANRLVMPGILCEGSCNGVELLTRGMGSSGYADAAAGLGVENLHAVIRATEPEETAFGRLFVTYDWQSVTVVDGGFEVPVHVTGQCLDHPHPIFYVATSEESTFVVIIPWEGARAQLPSDEAAVLESVRILRATKPVDVQPYGALFMESVDVRHVAKVVEIEDAAALSMPDGKALQVAEFSSLSITPGREMPGCLPREDSETCIFTVKRPFGFGLWHAAIDDLNVPLAFSFVV